MKLLATLVFLGVTILGYGQNSLETRIASAKKAMEENPAPSGFSWEYVSELNAAFLKPETWVVSRKMAGQMFVLAISEEDPGTNGRFQHGFTVMSANLNADSGDVVEYAKQARDHLVTTYPVITQKDFDLGPFKAFNCLSVMRKERIGMFSLTLANPKTRTVYLLTFEAPVADYDRYLGSLGNAMIDNLLLDDEL